MKLFKKMDIPRFLICDALPSVGKDNPDIRNTEFVIDTDLGMLWGFGDSFNGVTDGRVVSWLSDPIKDPQILAEAARMAGEWLIQCHQEEDDNE